MIDFKDRTAQAREDAMAVNDKSRNEDHKGKVKLAMDHFQNPESKLSDATNRNRDL
jgi:hypothetical protein